MILIHRIKDFYEEVILVIIENPLIFLLILIFLLSIILILTQDLGVFEYLSIMGAIASILGVLLALLDIFVL